MLDGAGHRCGCSGGPCSFRAEVLILFPGSGSASEGRHRERTAANFWCLNSLWSISRMLTWPFQSVSWLQLHILDLWDFKSLVNLQNDTVYIKRLPIVNINMVLGWKPDLEQEFEYVDWTKCIQLHNKKAFWVFSRCFWCLSEPVSSWVLSYFTVYLHTLFLWYIIWFISTPPDPCHFFLCDYCWWRSHFEKWKNVKV